MSASGSFASTSYFLMPWFTMETHWWRSAGSFNIHEVLCLDHLWVDVGVYRAGYEADPSRNVFQVLQIWFCFFAYAIFGFYVHYTFSMNPTVLKMRPQMWLLHYKQRNMLPTINKEKWCNSQAVSCIKLLICVMCDVWWSYGQICCFYLGRFL